MYNYFPALIAGGAPTDEEDTYDAPVEMLFTEDASMLLGFSFPQHNSLRNSLLNCLK